MTAGASGPAADRAAEGVGRDAARPADAGDPADAADPARRRIGVDIGGTFTDFVVFDPGTGRLDTFKLPSTPGDPAEAVLRGLRRVGVGSGTAGAAERRDEVVHGSTVATNAVLERKGASTALVTTRGFRDLLRIGRQDRPALYDLFADPPPPLVPPERCFEVDERVGADGEVLEPLDPEGLPALAARLREARVESAAVCLLFSFLRPEHERRVVEALRGEIPFVSASTEVLPEFREYERASTTALDAYVTPVLDRYLGRLDRELGGADLRILQSNGGSARAEEARRHGVRSILSGPAGGVVAALHVARAAGHERILTFDMGGTSTDVSLAEGAPRLTSEGEVAGLPVRVPLVDLHTVGSGGGSIATVDAGGALRVGPESAGAEPGPACYGRGGTAGTVTDANLVLGRLPPDRFLGGRMRLDEGAAREALARLASEAGLRGAESSDAGSDAAAAARRVALGVVRVAEAHMERALRVISVERGHDPRDFVLVAFGGAGGLHAARLARRLGIGRVLVPPAASTLSALGMLVAPVSRDYVRTVMLGGEVAFGELESGLVPLLERGREEVAAEGVPPDRVELAPALDLRYRGQSWELSVPFGSDYAERFHRAHERAYGWADRSAEVEVVNLRLRASGPPAPPPLPRGEPGPEDPGEALLERRALVAGGDAKAGGDRMEAPFYDGHALRPGHRIRGPAVVVREDTTVFLDRGDEARVDPFSNLLIRPGVGPEAGRRG